MQLNNHSYVRIMDLVPDGLYVVDTERKILYWNRAAEEISGFSSEDVMGRTCAGNVLCHIDHDGAGLCSQSCPMVVAFAGENEDKEIYLHHKDGHRVPVLVRTSTLTDDEDKVVGAVMIFTDISSKTNTEQRVKELEELALLDCLTHLANRMYLERELEARLEERVRYGIPFGVIFMDIDDFKRVNDCYGHEVGDRVLKFVARTLHANSRQFDLYGRWGGEEFVGVIHNITFEELQQIGERLRRLVQKSFLLVDGKRLQVTVSLGATLGYEEDCIGSVVQRADALMYRSKAAGKNRLTMG